MQISLEHLQNLCLQHPEWSCSDLMAYLNRIERVETLGIKEHAAYGAGQYGKSPYGSSRRLSDGKSPVPRRVTVNGQVSYRGRLYSIGKTYGGRTCKVYERKDQLLMLFLDRRPIYMTKRP